MGENCQSAVLDQLRLQSNDLRAKPGMWEACQPDVETWCSGISPGLGRVHNCLRVHRLRLASPNCSKMVHEVATAEAEDITISPKNGRCRQEREAFCLTVEHGEGRGIHCLQQHLKEDSFSKDCKISLAMLANMQNSTGSFLRNRRPIFLKAKRKQVKAEGLEASDQTISKWSSFQQHEGIITGAIGGSLVTLMTLAFAAVCYWGCSQRRLKNGGYEAVGARTYGRTQGP